MCNEGTCVGCRYMDHAGSYPLRATPRALPEIQDPALPETIEPGSSGAAGEVRVTSTTGGSKGQKQARYDLIPAEALELVARLYGRGAEKYDSHNWRKGYDWSLSFAALNRHLWQFWNGEDIDEEMGLPHMACVIFHAMTLLTYMKEHPEFDDRYSTTQKNPQPEEG